MKRFDTDDQLREYIGNCKDIDEMEQKLTADGYDVHDLVEKNPMLRDAPYTLIDAMKSIVIWCSTMYDENVEPWAKFIAYQIRELDTWDDDLNQDLCDLAGMLDEYEQADGDTFESVVFAAAEKLNVEII